MLYLYAARNFSALVGLASPEPMANMYDTTYFRATWVLTALDAGFWTAMKIRPKWMRDIASMVFSVFYLFAAERADEKVRKVRGAITVEHLRVSWNKGTTPYLGFFQKLLRPRFTRWPPRQVRIPRPTGSDYKEPVIGWLYYDGPLAELKQHDRVIIDVPGGGFVAMDPRCNDDKLFAWASKTGLPILSLDYKKAPEFPYPYALNECFDVYSTMITTRGKCIGLSGAKPPRIIMTGDSAGGNLVVAAVLMILETSMPRLRGSPFSTELPPPDGLVCFYPALDVNIGNWMSDEQMSMIQDRKMRKTNRPIVRRKSRQYNDLVGTPHHSDEGSPSPPGSPVLRAKSSLEMEKKTRPEFSHSGPQKMNENGQTNGRHHQRRPSTSHQVEPLKTRLATSSMISYFNDRVLTPELMRAMIILYIGPHNRPDFSTEYFLSPVLAPEAILAKFPKTYFMTGERDPLVDDTVIFSGRIRAAKEMAANDESELEDMDMPEVVLIPGISHGFMQFPSIYPPAWKHFDRCAGWFNQLFSLAENKRIRRSRPRPKKQHDFASNGDLKRSSRRMSFPESSGDEDRPLEIGMTRITRGRSATTSHAVPTMTSGSAEKAEAVVNGEGSKKAKKSGGIAKSKSLMRLNSSDDLLGRRMQGLAGGLTGMVGDD